MDSVPSAILVLGPLSAILLHEFVLRRVEIDRQILPIITVPISVFWLLAAYTNFVSALLITACFWVPLWIKIGVYRVFYHPLKAFPGPFTARLSKWWTFKKSYETDLHYYRVQQAVQKQYGDYVRTGPRELSVFDPAAVQPILGFSSKTSKGPFFDIFDKSLHLTRDKAWHRQRRRVWDNAMKTSISDYAPQIEAITDQLLTRLKNEEGKSVDLHLYMCYYGYDVMAALAMGQSTGFIRGESSELAQGVLNTLHGSLSFMGYTMYMPWLLNAIAMLTQFSGPVKGWRDWSVSQMEARIAAKDPQPDLISHLIAVATNDNEGRELLYGESRLIISAGSETTSTALTFIFIQMATHPSYAHAVRKEFREHAAEYNSQRPLPMIEAVINESMRIWPSVFWGSQRVTPPEGMTINDHFIPGNIIVNMPLFPLFRDPRNFVRPDEFIPERWNSRPELILNKGAFIPFSTGPYSCAGKALALMEMRSVVGRVLNEFDVVMPDGFDEQNYWASIKDHFTAGPPKQFVNFVRAKE